MWRWHGLHEAVALTIDRHDENSIEYDISRCPSTVLRWVGMFVYNRNIFVCGLPLSITIVNVVMVLKYRGAISKSALISTFKKPNPNYFSWSFSLLPRHLTQFGSFKRGVFWIRFWRSIFPSKFRFYTMINMFTRVLTVSNSLHILIEWFYLIRTAENSKGTGFMTHKVVFPHIQ